MDVEYARKGGVATALALGGTALGVEVLRGGLSGILGGNCACSENMPVTRFELEQQNKIASKDMEIAYYKGREEAKSDSLALYQYFDGRLRGIEAQNGQQAVYNATNTATISCLQQQIATLAALTKVVVPITNVCPQPAVATTSAAG